MGPPICDVRTVQKEGEGYHKRYSSLLNSDFALYINAKREKMSYLCKDVIERLYGTKLRALGKDTA